MKKKNKTVWGILVLAGCLFLGCGKRKMELFTEERQNTADVSKEQTMEWENTGFGEAAEAELQNGFLESGEADRQDGQQISGGRQEDSDPAFDNSHDPASDNSQEEPAGTIFVHVCGAVKNPGVYELAGNVRVYQAVEAAGGFLPEACEYYINQAGILTDGKRLYIPTEEEVRSLAKTDGAVQMTELLLQPEEEAEAYGAEQSEGQKDAEKTALVNINTASLSELCTLPGIGEGKAASIIRYRENTGRFEQIEDIMKVEGIKEGLFGRIRDLITTG